MKAQDLKIGTWYKYKDDNESCSCKVIAIDDEKQEVSFIDDEDFEWESPFEEIPETIVRELK